MENKARIEENKRVINLKLEVELVKTIQTEGHLEMKSIDTETTAS